MRKKVLVYPCGTEIGLEIYRAVSNSIHFEVYGGSSSYDHGRFVYKKHIDNLPFITDHSTAEEIRSFNDAIASYGFDYVYPAMDGVITVFSKFSDCLTPIIVAPSYDTTRITRSKKKTYEMFKKLVPTPKVYESWEDVTEFPVFMKPDVGQGSSGTILIKDRATLENQAKKQDGKLVLEYLPGEEFTIDCFTNEEGKLVYAKGRGRRRIKGGISVNAVFCENPEFQRIAEIINAQLKQKGAWFFQLKEACDGRLKLLEIASRIAGTSAITRCIGVNLPLLTLNIFHGQSIDSVLLNEYPIELDRALGNRYKVEIPYDKVYVDYDDTLIVDGKVNLQMVCFLYQCINQNKNIILLTKHDGSLEEELKKYRIAGLFDQVVHIRREEEKRNYIESQNAIFIDDSYNERRMVKEQYQIPVFDTHMIECLLEE